MTPSNQPPRRVAVYCGSAFGNNPAFLSEAKALGAAIAAAGLGLVYGGTNIGLMGAVADAALAGGAHAIGVLPELLAGREIAHDGLTQLVLVPSMHERKARMADLADAFVALPGGMGTLEELAEILTWAQLGLHRKAAGVLDVRGYWRPLLAFLDHAVQERFLRPEHRALLLAREDPAELLDALAAFEPTAREKWIDRGQS